MSASLIRWGLLALIYLAFHSWYGGSGNPLTPKEVDTYIKLAQRLDPDTARLLEAFASTDDGNEFVMVNLNQYRSQPRYEDGRKASGSSEEVEAQYTSKMLRRLLARASHPLVVVEPIQNLPGAGDFERTRWDRAAFIRYRSRRDFLEIALASDFHEDIQHKWAALQKTHSFPSRPLIWGAGVRLVLFFALLCIGLLLDRIFTGASRN